MVQNGSKKMNYLIKKYKDIEVAWLPELNGGGMTHGQQFIPVVKRRCGKVNSIFEFCAGPGFIGFSLLAEGLCSSLCVADANPLAVEALKETVRRNRLSDMVSVYQSNGLNDLPKTERWDLVVANPPHFNAEEQEPDGYSKQLKASVPSRFAKANFASASNAEQRKQQVASRFANSNKTPEFWLIEDHGWKIHKDFYLKIQKFLKQNGKILMQENYLGSEEKDFIPFIEAGRLSLKRSFMYKVQDEMVVNSYYFLEIENTSEYQHNKAERQTIQEGSESQGPQGLLMQIEGIIPIKLAYLEKRTIKLAPWQKYKFELKNDTQRNIHAGFYRESPPAFFKQKPMLSVSPGERKKSSIFHLTKGTYLFIDLDTQEKIAEVKVE